MGSLGFEDAVKQAADRFGEAVFELAGKDAMKGKAVQAVVVARLIVAETGVEFEGGLDGLGDVTVAKLVFADDGARVEVETKPYVTGDGAKVMELAMDVSERPLGVSPLDVPFPGAPGFPSEPAPHRPEWMPDAARLFLQGSTAFIGGEMVKGGQHLDDRIWRGLPGETREKFERLMEEHNLQRGVDGYPIPRRPVDRLITEDRMQVADPITGQYHTMLKRHLRVAHDLDHEELLAMFNLSEKQLPRSGPGFSESKAAQARKTGLGKNKKPATEEAREKVA